jgi:uncharacterized protein YkwD
MTRRCFAAALAFALVPLAIAQEKKDEKKDELKLTKEERELIDLTNAERKKAWLNPFAPNPRPLAPNPQLMAAARAHAANMAKQEKAEHVLDEKGHTDRAKDAGYKYGYLGENVAWNQDTPKEVMSDWMNSKVHKENILKPEYTEIGVAVAKSKKGEPYWVQLFGSPEEK